VFERFTPVARAAVVTAQDQARRLGHPMIGTPHLLLALLAADGDGGRTLAEAGVTAEAVEAGLSGLLQYGSEHGPEHGPEHGGAPAAGPATTDDAALAALGIDAARIRAAIEASFGPGALDRLIEPPRTRRRTLLTRLGRRGPGRGRRTDPRRHAPDRVTPRDELEALRRSDRHQGTSHLPFTPAAKKAVEMSLREALRLGDRRIDDEHLLLGAIGRADAGASVLLGRLGIDPAAVRRRIEDRHRRSA